MVEHARLRPSDLAGDLLGLEQPPTFRLLYENTAAKSFGRSRSLRCPHYLEAEGGRCGIWKHRASVCATWFCKHARGATGMRFWQAVHQLLSSIEGALSRWCVLELDVGVWEDWHGREAEFYRECARRVNGLAWDDLVAISGPDTRILARLVQAAYSALISGEIPGRLKAGPLHLVRMDGKSCRIWAHSGADPLDIPRALMDALPYFEGRTTAQALGAIETEEHLRLDPALVRRLVDFEILVQADSENHSLKLRRRRARRPR